MLVKFLSYTVSVIGTARYKTVLLSCLALIFSLTGITAIALWHGSGTKTASSTVEQQSDTKSDQQQGSQELGGSRKQSIENNKQATAEPKQNTEQQTAPSADQPESSQQNQPDNQETAKQSLDVRLTTDKVTLPASSTSVAVSAMVNNGSTINWAVVAAESDNLQVITDQENTSSITFRIRATENAKPGTYQVMVYAKDAAQNSNISKTISVTVQ